MYHERQERQYCLRHTLNNLAQRQLFTTAALDEIACGLAPAAWRWRNPHFTVVWGNYDVNVLEVALQQMHKELVWHDKRDTSFESLDLEGCWALILNVSSSSALSALLGGRHWFGVRRFGDYWYNLDSELEEPAVLACSRADGDSSDSGSEGRPAPCPDGDHQQSVAEANLGLGQTLGSASGGEAGGADQISISQNKATQSSSNSTAGQSASSQADTSSAGYGVGRLGRCAGSVQQGNADSLSSVGRDEGYQTECVAKTAGAEQQVRAFLQEQALSFGAQVFVVRDASHGSTYHKRFVTGSVH